MKGKLLLVRHAETVDKTPEIKDLERHLTTEGFRNSSLLGNIIKEKKIFPDLIVSSNAIRAFTTAQLVAERIGYDISRILINDDVYEASTRILLGIINQLKNDLSIVMMVGHNPAISYLAEYVSNAEIGDFSPASVACFDLLVDDWAAVSANTCELTFFETPASNNQNNN
jgi:phosphohistidine phosphatase